MFKKNKFMLDKCSIRVYYCGIRTKHKTTKQEENMITREDLANKKIDKLENAFASGKWYEPWIDGVSADFCRDAFKKIYKRLTKV